ncbi:MAG: DUF86 domain-containing protein [bacterium]|nr:DUF86 domain-containing protein [bacterium]
MQPDPKDMARLWDMLDAGRAAIGFTAGRRYEDLLADRMLRSAVERNLEIIGEAARCVSLETRENYPDIPWRSMIGLRNVLAHEYGDIRYEILWAIIGEKLAPLIQQLEDMGVDNPPPVEET